MEMGGNLSERCVNVGTSQGRTFTGLSGDGELSTLGASNVSNWPNSNGQAARGGNFRRSNDRMMVSTREFGYYPDNFRLDNIGWRGARTAD